MKNRISIIAIVSLFIASLNLQAQNLGFGVKGGLNYSSLNLTFTTLDKNATGYHIGGFVKVPLAKKFSIQPELLYSTKGAEVRSPLDFLTGSIGLQLNYLDLPVVVNYDLTDLISVHGGGYASYLLDSRAKLSTPIPFLNFSHSLGTDAFSKLDYGLVAGAGLKLGSLGAGVRYNHGFEKVERLGQLIGTDLSLTGARNSVWQVYLSVSF